MSYDEEEQRRSRVVVQTPTARREVVQTQTSRVPDRRGVSTGVVAAVALTAIALTAIIVWALTRNNDTANDNTNVHIATTQPTPVQQQQPVIVQQPAPAPQQQPIIVQQPAAPPQTVVVPAPAEPATRSSSTVPNTNIGAATRPSVPDDSTIQSSIDKKLSDDPTFSSLNLTASVINGKVTLIGTVDSPALKRQAERLVRSIKGVHDVDNQITVTSGTE